MRKLLATTKHDAVGAQGGTWMMAGLAAGLAMEGFCATGTSAPAVSPGPSGGTEMTCARPMQPSTPLQSLTSSGSQPLVTFCQ